MPYILKKTNGTTLTTVQDASVDNSTSLTFVGRNYSGYGQPVEENFIKLLENFANNTQPVKPVLGQLWFNSDVSSRRLFVSYDGSNFRDIANVPYSETSPDNATTGDLWWDSINSQLKVYDSVSNTWTASQANGGSSSSWDFSRLLDTNLSDQNAIRGLVGSTTVLEISNTNFKPDSSTGISTAFPNIKKGINLPGADPVYGSSAINTTTGYLIWGTAADALKSQKVDISETTNTGTHYLLFSTNTSGTQRVYTTSTFSYDPLTDVLNVTAASALYADIAERYEADAVYEPGTVLVIGGDKEVTTTTIHGDIAVAGIVSTKPAYMMNKDAGTDETHPYIALKGRVPCKVFGPVKKGDLLVTSSIPGYAEPMFTSADNGNDSPNAVLGIALASHASGPGIVEVKV